MKETSLTVNGNSLVMDFNILDDWDSFEEIAELLCDYFQAKVI